MMTPLDVQSKEFSKALNGYNRNEVEDFLNKMSDVFESLMRESDYLKTQVTTAEKKLTEYQIQENSLKEALLIAQITANDMLKKAKIKADEIVKNAEEEAEKALGSVKSDYVKIENATKSLKKDYGDFKQKYQYVLREQIKVLDHIELEANLQEKVDV